MLVRLSVSVFVYVYKFGFFLIDKVFSFYFGKQQKPKCVVCVLKLSYFLLFFFVESESFD